MYAETAEIKDIPSLVTMRMEYLKEDHGQINEEDEKLIRERLPEYFKTHLCKDLFCFVVRQKEEIVSCAFLLITEKPMSPSFLNGRTGTVLNVYTKPENRRKGYAKAILQQILFTAEQKELSTVELKATDDGYPLYKSIGFHDENQYHHMKWKNPKKQTGE